MFVQEAKKIKELIEIHFGHQGSTVLDIGSSSSKYRCEIQPHIDNFVFKPLREKGCDISYLDKKSELGIDIVADLSDPDFIKPSQFDSYDLILCANILEHVEDRNAFLNNLLKFAHSGSIILITVPFNYFKHLDPIDTMYRPSPRELEQWILRYGEFEIKHSSYTVIDDDRYYKRKIRMARYLPVKISVDFWKNYFELTRWKVTCLVIKKTEPELV